MPRIFQQLQKVSVAHTSLKKVAVEIHCCIQAFHKSLKIRSDMLYEICIRTLTLKRLRGFDFRTPVVKLLENRVNNLLIM